jgi:hypothetical protein
MKVSGQLHTLATLHPGKEPSEPIAQVGFRAGLDAVAKEKAVPCRESNAGP